MQLMKDSERRGIILERFFDARHEVDWLEFEALGPHVAMDWTEI
jgi:hypothetical protein